MGVVYMGGICGMGMAPLAILLKAAGNTVLGFDDNADIRVKNLLQQFGIECQSSFNEAVKPDLFVISTALCSRNLKSTAKIQRRGVCFADFCKNRKLVAITGSHGKSTVSNLCAHAINKLSLNAGYMVGALSEHYAPAKFCKDGEYMFSEIDESDATIENFSPEICVALNYDLDHTDTYKNADALKDMFCRLFERTKQKIIVPSCDKTLCELAKASGKNFEIVQIGPDADFSSINALMAQCALKSVFGNALNCTVLNSFEGTYRRQEVLCNTPALFAMADYAHHPSEVKAFLNWFGKKYGNGNYIFFQPHRYSRTKCFAKTFAQILEDFAKQGNSVYVLPVYAASEKFDELGTSDKITQNSQLLKLASFSDMQKIVERLKTGGKKSAAFVGAGDIYFKAKEFILQK